MNRSSLLTAVAVILFASLLVFSAPLVAQEKPAGKTRAKHLSANTGEPSKAGKPVDESLATPRIYFPEPLHDFGAIARGSKVTHKFKVVNNGDAPLRLIKAKGS